MVLLRAFGVKAPAPEQDPGEILPQTRASMREPPLSARASWGHAGSSGTYQVVIVPGCALRLSLLLLDKSLPENDKAESRTWDSWSEKRKPYLFVLPLHPVSSIYILKCKGRGTVA